MSHSERVSDLIALADLVPGRWISTFRADRRSWRDVLEEIRATIATYAGDWPAARVEDQAHLRLRLYRECGI